MRSSISPEEVLSQLEILGTRLGLETSRRLLTVMGSPHLRLSVVLVAGTNGKGSVAALLASMASAAGYRTGLFTSPHLESVTERLKIDGRSIDREELGSFLDEITRRSLLEVGAPATYFEALFIAACRWFAAEQIDLVILEVGLGGRLDATNVTEPVLSVITEIDLEHRAQLGETIAEIAREKAGILRPHRPVVVGARNREALDSLRAAAREVGAEWVQATERIEVVDRAESSDWSRRLRLHSTEAMYDARLRLAGRHQEENLVTAVAAAEHLRRLGWSRLDRSAIERGITACVWPGRLERIDLPQGRKVVLDAAHNPHAARQLSRFLAQRLPGYSLVFGVLDDKDAGEMLPPLSALAQSVILTRPDSTRSRDPHELVQWSDCPDTTVVESPKKALGRALKTGLPVVVCGSIYLIGEARGQLRRTFGLPLAF
jgi:dihydrofolate synthase/folylpolyglutamate synthase